jgi:hypothetical protein
MQAMADTATGRANPAFFREREDMLKISDVSGRLDNPCLHGYHTRLKKLSVRITNGF